MNRNENWQVARLIPLPTGSGVEAKERHAASALLAVLSVVGEFGRALLKPLGAPSGKIEAFIEVAFKTQDGKTVRPDGLIGVSRAGRTWWALVECKISDQRLSADQMEGYLDVAREAGIDAVLSISNQYASHSSQYPVPLDRKKLRRVAIHHWSWVRVLTEAEVQRQYRGVKDPDQAYILGELIRYMSDSRSGVTQFNDMGGSWVAVREGARLHALRKTGPEVAEVANRWDELMRFLSLDLTKELGLDVREAVRRGESVGAGRHQALRESLASSGQLYGELHIPNTAGSLEVVADLSARQIFVSTVLDAPREGLSRGRVGWLLRQLQKAPGDLTIEARTAYSSTKLTGKLSDIRENPGLILPERTREIRAFRLTLAREMGLNRAGGRGSFIQSVVKTTKSFYGDVLQHLVAWKPRAPRLPDQSASLVAQPPVEAEIEVLADRVELTSEADAEE
jgi:hypothetical protein